MNRPILSVEHLTMNYKTRKGNVSAIDDVSFTLEKGQSLGLVGESGCGKTSLAFALMRLLPDNALVVQGKILLDGNDLLALSDDAMRKVRWNHVSMVFQAAMNALNPVYTVGDQIIEALELHERSISKSAAKERVLELFDFVGIDHSFIDRYPHQFSGGMRQRAVIAMALACRPELIIADEPTTALDVIVQDRILKKLKEIQDKFDMSMIYVSHDIAVIAEVSDKIAVMYAGRMAELGPVLEIFDRPLHPYTNLLLGAFPSIIGERKPLTTIEGEPPNLLDPPKGCRFHPRCAYATEICRQEQPAWEDKGHGHYVACWHPLNMSD